MYRHLVIVCVASTIASSGLRAAPMPAEQQTALVTKYCAVCHTDAVKNGGLSLQHYDAAKPDPALAAMLLSKLRGGAMGAAGIGIPDAATREAWVATTVAQAERAKDWTLFRSDAGVLMASTVREVKPRNIGDAAPVYRLIVACDGATRRGELQVTWAPSAQTDRVFSVSVDGNAGAPHRLEGREEKMGNGSAGTTGFAAAVLRVGLPEKALTIRDLFPGETVVFGVGDLDRGVRRELGVCFSGKGAF